MSLKKIFLTSLLLYFSTSLLFAANTIRRGNLIIDLDTGKITIANNNAEYQSLLTDGSDSTTTGSSSTVQTDTTQHTNTQSGSTSSASTGSTILQQPIIKPSTTPGSELENAINRGYSNEITIFDTVDAFRPNDLVSRAQAAKFFSQGAEVIGYQNNYTGNCSFNDTNNKDPLLSSISKACTMGLMKGNGISFRPDSSLTYAESITILSKIAGYHPNTTTTSKTRRQQYYDFIAPLQIIPDNFDIKDINKNITRGDMISMLYKLSQKDSNRPVSGIANNSSNSPVSLGAGISDDPEFTTALLWMNKAGMTKFWKVSDYNPFTALTREQGAYFFSIYDQKFDTNTTSGGDCLLQDINTSSFTTAIDYVCKKGILRGGNNSFRPSDSMTKVEFIAGMLNMLNESFGGSGSRQNNTYKKALSLEIINRSDEATFDKPITRYEVAILFHKLYLKNQFKKSLSDANANYNVISPVEPDNHSYSGHQEKVNIDINSIDNKDFTNGFVTLFGQNYKLSKKQVTQYFPTSYVWYGELMDITEDKIIGTISMSIGQQGIRKLLIDGYVVIDSEGGYYNIQNTDQIGHYIISKIK